MAWYEPKVQQIDLLAAINAFNQRKMMQQQMNQNPLAGLMQSRFQSGAPRMSGAGGGPTITIPQNVGGSSHKVFAGDLPNWNSGTGQFEKWGGMVGGTAVGEGNNPAFAKNLQEYMANPYGAMSPQQKIADAMATQQQEASRQSAQSRAGIPTTEQEMGRERMDQTQRMLEEKMRLEQEKLATKKAIAQAKEEEKVNEEAIKQTDKEIAAAKKEGSVSIKPNFSLEETTKIIASATDEEKDKFKEYGYDLSKPLPLEQQKDIAEALFNYRKKRAEIESREGKGPFREGYKF